VKIGITPLAASLAVATGLAGVGWAVWMRHRLGQTERDRRRAVTELNRRLSELFSLQELAYVLSESLELDRIVDQIVRYAMRFFEAQGALVALLNDQPADGETLVIAGAEGSLSALLGRRIPAGDPGLIARALRRERPELVPGSRNAPTELLDGQIVASAAAVPLRTRGSVVGSLVVVDPPTGAFATDDIRLLSTIATHGATVLANARFFELMRRGKDQWETAFDALSEGVAVVDEAGRVRRANRALAALLAMPIADVVGRDLGEVLLADSPALRELLARVRREPRPQPVVTRSAPLRRMLRMMAARIPDATDEFSVVILVEDVTDERAMEAQLVQSEKLAAVGQLVSGVAHELNNPLTSITGLSELLLEQPEGSPRDRDHLRVIHEQAERASRLVRNLLTFARPGPSERALIDLNDVVERTVLLMNHDLRLKGIAIETSAAQSLPLVLGDRHALQQVVLNLLTNAAQAVAHNAPERKRVIRVTTSATDRVRVRVADSGPGIPDHVLPHLFTPFFTTKEPGQGTGLGLSITYSIVEAHGGHTSVDRPPEGGAVFVVELPAASAAPEPSTAERPAATPAPPESVPSSARKRSILLVDDDPGVRRTVKALFAREGHSVDVARNPLQAIDMARARGYDLILADVQASVRGRLFVEALVEANPGLRDRTLVATGDIRPATEETLARLGLRYVRKPFNLRDLLAEAARVWAAKLS
jgi:two-component system, NtrC family, sensor kinase